MGINKVEELNQKRFQKRQEVQIFLNNLTTITDNQRFNVKTEGIKFELTGLIDKFSRESVKIALLSEISSGKSTFLNALVFNEPILESKIGETTAKLFHIKYGEEYTIDGVKKENIHELKNKIASENSKNLEAIMQDREMESIQSVITLPDENLKKGVELYDTPGFAAIKEKRIITLLKDVISQSDVTILLLDISQGIKESEHLFIRNMFRNIQINKRFIVLNKYDTIVNEDDLVLKSKKEIKEEIETLITGIEDTLQKLQNDTTQKIESYYLSAKKALVGKVTNDAKKLEESRFPIFEEAFWKRVVEAKDELLEDNIQIFDSLKVRVNTLLKEQRAVLKKEKRAIELKIESSREDKNKILALKKDIEELRVLNQNTKKRQQEMGMEMYKVIEDILFILKTNLLSRLTTLTSFQKLQFWTLKNRYKEINLSTLEDANSYITQQVNNFILHSSQDKKEMNQLIWDINQNLKELLIKPDYDKKVDLDKFVDRVIEKMEKNIRWDSSTFFALLKYNTFTNDSQLLEPSYFELKQEILTVQKANNRAIIERKNEREKYIKLIEKEIAKIEESIKERELLHNDINEIEQLMEKIDRWLN